MAQRSKRGRFARRLRARRRLALTLLLRALHRGHQWLPSWGTSVLVHAVALLILALVYLGGNRRESGRTIETTIGPPESRIGEAIETSTPADIAGDPWASDRSAKFPSIGVGTPDPLSRVSNLPAAPPALKFAPNVSLPRINAPRGLKLSDTVTSNFHVEDMTAPFSGRGPALKAELIRREGGSVASEAAVQAGLEWLARHQRADGAWTLDYHAQCSDVPCPDETPTASDTAATGLGLLPFLGAGHIHTDKDSRYRETVKRGLDYLVSRQGSEGELFIGGGRNYLFYSHAIAAMALCEAYGLSKDPRLRVPASRAIAFIVKNQNLDDGGWRYFPGQAGDTSVIGWQIFALRSAQLAGIDVPKRSVQGCRGYLDLASADPRKSTYAYMPGRAATPVMTAEGLLCRQYLGWPSDEPALRSGAKVVWADLQMGGQRNIYYWYYATQLLHNMGGKDWIAWNKHIRDGLVRMQVGGQGCDRGSWDPLRPEVDVWGRTAGRHFVTSLSILTLEVYYRWLPLYRPVGGVDPKDAQADRKAL